MSHAIIFLWVTVTFWWALWDAMLLYGKGSLNHHWLYWQDAIGMFNDENPSGTVATADWFRRIIAVMIIVALSVSFKRYLLGLHLGVRLYGTLFLLSQQCGSDPCGLFSFESMNPVWSYLSTCVL